MNDTSIQLTTTAIIAMVVMFILNLLKPYLDSVPDKARAPIAGVFTFVSTGATLLAMGFDLKFAVAFAAIGAPLPAGAHEIGKVLIEAVKKGAGKVTGVLVICLGILVTSSACGQSKDAQTALDGVRKFTRVVPPTIESLYRTTLIACDGDAKCESDAEKVFAPVFDALGIIDQVCETIPAVCEEPKQ